MQVLRILVAAGGAIFFTSGPTWTPLPFSPVFVAGAAYCLFEVVRSALVWAYVRIEVSDDRYWTFRRWSGEEIAIDLGDLDRVFDDPTSSESSYYSIKLHLLDGRKFSIPNTITHFSRIQSIVRYHAGVKATPETSDGDRSRWSSHRWMSGQ